MNGNFSRIAYCVSKLALTILTRILAKDWKAKGVLINSVSFQSVQLFTILLFQNSSV